MFASNPELETEVAIIVRMLSSLSVGAVLSYHAITEAIGRDIQSEARTSLLRARQAAEKETGVLYGTVSNVGIKRLPSSETPSVGFYALKSISRKARRTINRLDNLSANL